MIAKYGLTVSGANLTQGRNYSISHMWKGTCRATAYPSDTSCGVVSKGIRWNMGSGDTIRFWEDVWATDSPLFEHATAVIPPTLLNRNVQDFWSESGGLNWNLFSGYLPTTILMMLTTVSVGVPPGFRDSICWSLTSDGEDSSI